MTIGIMILFLIWSVLAVCAYRLGLADGLSAARNGRLVGAQKCKGDILDRLDAYNGRKEKHGATDLA